IRGSSVTGVQTCALPILPSLRGGVVELAVPAPQAAALAALARAEGSTLYMVLLAVFQALLLRLTGQRDVSVGAPVANRERVEIRSEERRVGKGGGTPGRA